MPSIKQRVLVATTSPIRRRLVCESLRKADYAVETAADGQAVVNVVRETPFDVILIDCDLPRVDGLEATRRIRRLERVDELAEGSPNHVRILGLSAGDPIAVRDDCREAGMDEVVSKSIKSQDLLKRVQCATPVSDATSALDATPVEAATGTGDPIIAADEAPAAVERPAVDDRPGPVAGGGKKPDPDSRVFRVRVLVVEDNALNRMVCTTILKKAGHEVAVAEDGKIAVDYLLAEPCDLVLMDCQMPVMDGFESTRTIRQLESDQRLAKGCPAHIPIIAVTANAMAGDREKCLAAGMDDYMTKPVIPAKLLEAIDRYARTASS